MTGLMLLAAAVVIEVIVAALKATPNDPRRGARAAIRVGAVVSFGLLAATGAITWGPRFYAFAAALVVLALVSAARALLRAQPAASPARRYGGVWRAVGTSVIMAVTAFPAILFGEYAPLPTTGRHEVRERCAARPGSTE